MPPRPPTQKPPPALPGPPGPPEQARQAHLQAYFRGLLRGLYRSKAELFTLEGAARLRDALVADLAAALQGLGLTAEAAQDLAVEAAGAALAKTVAKKVLSWLR